MADYYCVSRTNYFKVKKINDFKTALSDKSFCEDPLSIWENEGRVALGAYGSITAYYDEDSGDMLEIFPILQEHLDYGEVIILQESGYEKLRYITGFAWIITKDEVRFIDVLDEAIKAAQGMVEDPLPTEFLVPQY